MRNDGRAAGSLRPVSIKTEYLKYAEGSCLIEMGNTKVICSASIEDGVPPFLRNKGKGWITAEYGMLPRSCQTRIPREASTGKRSGRTFEIQRLIGRSMRAAFDFDKLGERTVWIDCDVIQGDGGTRCASITGSFVAVCLALESLKKRGVVGEIPLLHHVAAVSVGIVDGKPCLDLSYEEDSSAEVDMNVIMTDAGEFVEVQGTAEKEPFSHEMMRKMIDLAEKGVSRLIKIQKDTLKGVVQ